MGERRQDARCGSRAKKRGRMRIAGCPCTMALEESACEAYDPSGLWMGIV